MKDFLGNAIDVVIAIAGSAIASLFGGWSSGIKVLLIVMLIDMITGITAAVMQKSTKTKSGAYNSYVSWKGIIKKVITLLIIALAHQLDAVLNITVIRDATIIFFIVNEATSILENAGQLGIKYPAIIQKALDVLNKKSDEDIS